MCGNPTRKDRLLLKLHDHFPKVRLPLWATLLAAVLLAGAITLITPGAITDAIGCGLLVVIYISQKMLTSGPVSKTAG